MKNSKGWRTGRTTGTQKKVKIRDFGEEWLELVGRNRITRVLPSEMRMLRRDEWRKKQSQEDLSNMDKVWQGDEVLEEDLQNFEQCMVVIGCDVEA